MKILLVVKVGSQEKRSNQLKYIQSKIKTKKREVKDYSKADNNVYHTSLLQVYRIKWSGKELLNKREWLPRGRIICCALLMSFPCQLIAFEIIKNNRCV